MEDYGLPSTHANMIGSFALDDSVIEYPDPTPTSLPESIVTARDGSIWFTENNGNKIGRLVPPAGAQAVSVAAPALSPLSLAMLGGILVMIALRNITGKFPAQRRCAQS